MKCRHQHKCRSCSGLFHFVRLTCHTQCHLSAALTCLLKNIWEDFRWNLLFVQPVPIVTICSALRQKYLTYRLMLFHYEYFIPEKTEMGDAEICTTKKLMHPDLHFVWNILNIHQRQGWHCSFVCLQRAALNSSRQNNRPNDPSCMGNNAFRLLDSTDSR